MIPKNTTELNIKAKAMSINDEKSLALLQQNCLLILKEIQKVCAKFHISYFLYFGTALGAVRHHGFIPWDDDIDLGMTLNNYQKFINVCLNGGLDNDFFELQSFDTEKHYDEEFIRIRLKNTLSIIPYHQEKHYKNLGVFVDIYCFYPVNNNQTKIKRATQKSKIFSRCFVNRIAYKHKTFKSKCLFAFIFWIKPEWLLKWREKSLINITNDDDYFLDYRTYRVSKKFILIKKDDVDDLIMVRFENQYFPILRVFDYILVKLYGIDYMKLPPMSLRQSHNPAALKLFDYDSLKKIESVIFDDEENKK